MVIMIIYCGAEASQISRGDNLILGSVSALSFDLSTGVVLDRVNGNNSCFRVGNDVDLDPDPDPVGLLLFFLL